MARAAAVIQAEIDEITTALSNIRKGGQSFEVTSGSAAGTKRVVTMADYDILVTHRAQLQAELNEVNNVKSFRMRVGW